MATDVLVVVVAYRADDHLQRCLEALGGAFPVTVVDNDAAGGSTRTRSTALNFGARYVPAPSNLGFAAGVNRALETSWDGQSDVLLLNPDARVAPTEIEALDRALNAVERRAAVGPLLFTPGGEAQRAAWPMPSPLQVWTDALGLGRFWRGPVFVTGAALLLKGAALAEVGRLDERYFLYSEEADWQLRALRAGWSVAVADDVRIVHVGGASSSDPRLRARLFYSSGQIFARRWYGRWGSAVMRVGRIVAALRRSVNPRKRAEQRELLRVCLRPTPRTTP